MDAPIAYQSASHSPCMGVREWTLFAKNLVGLQVCRLQLSRMMTKGMPAEVLLCEVSNWQVQRRSARAASEGQYGGDVGWCLALVIGEGIPAEALLGEIGKWQDQRRSAKGVRVDMLGGVLLFSTHRGDSGENFSRSSELRNGSR